MSPKPPAQLRRYWPVGIVLLAGLGISGWLGLALHRDAVKLDQERFDLETLQITANLEQNMERYEERLARLADYCAQFEELPPSIWSFRSQSMTDLDGNLPAVLHAVYCPKITATNFQTHLARGRAIWEKSYLFDPTELPGREVALPVWQFWSRPGAERVPPGTDMAAESESHPSLLPALSTARGWVSARPFQVVRTGGLREPGFWFGLTVFEPNPSQRIPPKEPGETLEQSSKHRGDFNRTVASGLLGVFLSTDQLVERAFNATNRPSRIHVRLYAAPQPAPDALFNRRSPAPPAPRHRRLLVQPWYGRRWCLEFASTPLFEAESARYRGWLLLGGGTGMTLLAGALVGVALRARDRQEVLAGRIREARDALAAAQQERQKLSHDLHDNTIQTLYAIQLGLTHTRQHLAAEPAKARGELSTLCAELDAVIAEMRRFILAEEGEGKPPDLSAVLRAMVDRARVGTKVQFEVRCDPEASERLAGNQAVQLANIAREALSNSLRHARPQLVQIALRSETEAVCLEVSDDGIGFDPQAQPRGVGLTSMATRAQDLGGTLEIQSAPGRGTRVAVRVPVFQDESGEAKWADDDEDEA